MRAGEDAKDALPEEQQASRQGLRGRLPCERLIERRGGGAAVRQPRCASCARDRRLPCGLPIPQEPILFAHDSPLLGNLALTLKQRLLPGGQLRLPPGDEVPLPGQFPLARNHQLPRRRCRLRSIAVRPVSA